MALTVDPIFFIMDELIIKKVEDVIHNKRFDFKTPEFTIVINEIIWRLNKLKGIPESIKLEKRRQYSMHHQELREMSFSSIDDFIKGLAYDAILMEKLYQGRLGQLDPVYFFSSTTYLSKVFPEFYQEDENRINLTIQRLNIHAGKKWIWNWAERSFAEKTIKTIQKVKIKEE